MNFFGFNIGKKNNVIVQSKAVIYESELDFISKCILDYPDIETGGDLFGFWTYSGYPVIQYAIGPGKDAYRSVAFFKQDKTYLEDMGNTLRERHGLQHIGEWHSHHRLGLAHPSGHDITTVVNAINDCNLGKFFLVIGTIEYEKTTINGFMFNKSNHRNYDTVGWIVLPNESPIRQNVDAGLPTNLIHIPKTLAPSHNPLDITTFENYTYTKPDFSSSLWLSNKSGQNELKIIINSLSERYGNVKMFLDKDNTGKLILILNVGNEQMEVVFLQDYPYAFPMIARRIDAQKVEVLAKSSYEENEAINPHRTLEYITSHIIQYKSTQYDRN